MPLSLLFCQLSGHISHGCGLGFLKGAWIFWLLLSLDVPWWHMGDSSAPPPTALEAPTSQARPWPFSQGDLEFRQNIWCLPMILLFLFMFLNNLFFILLQNNTCLFGKTRQAKIKKAQIFHKSLSLRELLFNVPSFVYACTHTRARARTHTETYLGKRGHPVLSDL